MLLYIVENIRGMAHTKFEGLWKKTISIVLQCVVALLCLALRPVETVCYILLTNTPLSRRGVSIPCRVACSPGCCVFALP